MTERLIPPVDAIALNPERLVRSLALQSIRREARIDGKTGGNNYAALHQVVEDAALLGAPLQDIAKAGVVGYEDASNEQRR